MSDAKDIDRRTYASRQHQDYLKPEEVLECEKFRIQDTYGMSVTPELVEKDDGGKLIKKIVALEAILAAPGEMITDEQGREFITPPAVVVDRDKSERDRLAICTDWSNHSTAWLMRHRLGLRTVLTDLMDGIKVTGNEATIEALAEFSKRSAPHVKGILNLTIPLDQSPIWILGQYLTQLGLSTKSRRPLEDGKRVRYYRLKADDVAFARKVLDYRQRQREEKERRRQEEQEQNAAYAARMQTQYGFEQRSRGAEEQRGKLIQVSPLHPCTHAPMPSSSPSTPPNNGDESNKWGGVDTNESLSNEWWQRVKYYAQLVAQKVDQGFSVVQEILSSLTSDERWGVIVEFEEFCPDGFAQLVADAPQWVVWME
ncbi:hypothetical protein VB735_28450 [Halotia wernerae UHCC 0503]|nr:hypothetical protein [Halotia wernerae UHCC 0503]